MIWSRVVPGKHVMAAFVLSLKEAEIKTEAIPVHMHQRQTATKHLKDEGEITPVMVHAVHIKNCNTMYNHIGIVEAGHSRGSRN